MSLSDLSALTQTLIFPILPIQIISSKFTIFLNWKVLNLNIVDVFK